MQPPRLRCLPVFLTYRRKMLTCNKKGTHPYHLKHCASEEQIIIKLSYPVAFLPPKVKDNTLFIIFYRWLNSKARRLVCGSQQKAAGGPRTPTLLPLMSPHQMKPGGSMRSVCSVFLSVYGLQMIFFLPRASVSEFTTTHKYKVTEFHFQTYTS